MYVFLNNTLHWACLSKYCNYNIVANTVNDVVSLPPRFACNVSAFRRKNNAIYCDLCLTYLLIFVSSYLISCFVPSKTDMSMHGLQREAIKSDLTTFDWNLRISRDKLNARSVIVFVIILLFPIHNVWSDDIVYDVKMQM